MTSETRARDTAVQSVDRAVSILEVLAQTGAVGVTEIASELAIHKSTVFRLLMTLEARGLVEQDTDRGKYRIGHTVVQLASGAAKFRDVAGLGHLVCQELAAAVGETVNVAIHDGLEIIAVDQAIGSASMTTVDWVGKREPLHTTAPGKIFLAHMPPAELEAVIAQGLPPRTNATITDAAELKKNLALVRELGYAATYEEHEVGLVAVAMPIRTLGGDIIAALTISGPTFRVNEPTLPGFLAQLEPAAAKISWRAGYIKRG